MTEKRFTIEIDDEKWVHILDNNVDIGQYNLCKVLNELNEENKKLKLKKQELEISLLNNQLAYNSLMNENEELKNIIKKVKE